MPAPDRSPEASSVVLIMRGQIGPKDIPRLCARVGSLLEAGTGGAIICDVGAVADPDASTIDVLARLQLTAQRLGSRLWLRHVRGDLQELLDLAGLNEVLPLAGCSVESRGETEEREQSGSVEEEADTGDLSI